MRLYRMRHWALQGAMSSDLGIYLFVFPALLPPFIADLLSARGRKSRLRRLRDSWGKPRPDNAPLQRVALYHRRRPGGPDAYAIDDQTWGDLDLDAVFRAIDHTNSGVGQQVLYDRLRSPRDEAGDLRALDDLSRQVARDEGLRDGLRLAFAGLDAKGALELPRLFSGALPDARRLRLLFPLLTAVTLAALAAVPLLAGWAIAAPLLLLMGNIALGLYYRRLLADIIPAIRPLHRLIVVGERLGAFADPELAAALGPLRRSCAGLGRLKRSCAYLLIENRFNEVAASFYAYLNAFFLADLNAIAAALHHLRRDRARVRALYEAVGAVDAALALASFRQGLPHYSTPEFTGRRKNAEATELYHPLLPDPVANSIAIAGASALVYGDNMSGKTTFMRALALCAILAQTLYTCPARSYRAPLLRVRTFINRKDDILGGKSYFLAEAEAVRDLVLAAGAEGPQCLFAIDELFKGTNPREGRAATRAVLEWLDADDHIALVATHDAQLQSQLGGGWAVYHFDSRVAAGQLAFDYRLRSGPAGPGNAIAVLAAGGFPAELTAAARRYLAGGAA